MAVLENHILHQYIGCVIFDAYIVVSTCDEHVSECDVACSKKPDLVLPICIPRLSVTPNPPYLNVSCLFRVASIEHHQVLHKKPDLATRAP